MSGADACGKPGRNRKATSLNSLLGPSQSRRTAFAGRGWVAVPLVAALAVLIAVVVAVMPRQSNLADRNVGSHTQIGANPDTVRRGDFGPKSQDVTNSEFGILARAKGAKDAQLARLETEVVPLLRSNSIGVEAFTGILEEYGPAGDSGDSAEEFAGQLMDAVSRLVAVRQSLTRIVEQENSRAQATLAQPDEEVVSMVDRAWSEVDQGHLNHVELLVESADLKSRLLTEASYAVSSKDVEDPSGWSAKFVTQVEIPQLAAIRRADGGSGVRIAFYSPAQGQLVDAFAELQRSGLLANVLRWCGSFNLRAPRGAPGFVSTHALGMAFDINCNELPDGKAPEPGPQERIAQVAAIFEKYGFIWGGRFSPPDAMHFQVARILASGETR
jgi:hypothetical protein